MVGAFDHLEWTYDGAFEQLFGLGRGKFSKNFPKIQMPGGLPGVGMFKFRFDWYIMFSIYRRDNHLHFAALENFPVYILMLVNFT